ncbi:rhamnulokinase [Enterococcus faecalis 13-SD-W-01]|nr:rhamnulokinase [Enterococcus faecalis 13-SD-W-01]
MYYHKVVKKMITLYIKIINKQKSKRGGEMKPTFLAIDIGASSGRIIQSTQEKNGQLNLQEIHRFKNSFRKKDGHDRWRIDYLIREILSGLEKAKQSGITQCYVGIDTWAVDYCLLDADGQRLGDPISYRDERTKNAPAEFAETFSLAKLYEKTGIQIQPFNTLFQLMNEEKEILAQADKLLLIPDYLGYVFTGKMVTEKTNASTMQLLNANTKTWDQELLTFLGVSENLFAPLVDPGTILGELRQERFTEYDLPETTFINVASHDTASAVLGTPGEGTNWSYISSGTWSLLGIETTVASVSPQAFDENYTNEWGAHNTIRFLKNIMGMWLIQETARMQDYCYTYSELAEAAAKEPALQQYIDINDPRFLNPENMIQEIQEYCEETTQKAPKTTGEIARCVYDNLALCYAQELAKLNYLTGNTIDKLHIVGGGSNNRLLNQLTADYAGIVVEAGPSEATAIGNVLMQMLCTNQFSTIEEARKVVKNSFEFEQFYPDKNKQETIQIYLRQMEGTGI